MVYSSGKGSGEEEVLPLGWNHLKNCSDLRHKSHVHHFICLIQYHRFQILGINSSFSIEIHKPSWRGD